MKKNTWINSTILSTLLGSLITFIIDYIKKKPMLTTIINIIKKIFNMIVTFLNFEIKVWWLLLGIILIIIGIFILDFFKEEVKDDPWFLEYKSKKFPFFRWSWEYEYDSYERKYKIINIKSHCPKCDTVMIKHNSYPGYVYGCPRCDFSAYKDKCDKDYKVEAVIIDDINRKNKSQ